MNLTGLRTFLTIAECGSLVRASERLNVTQSTVTARLKNLEDELGQSLFHRQKSGAELTLAGIRFKRYAEAMAGLWRQARQETARATDSGTAVNLTCPLDLWPVLGRRLVASIREHYPDHSVSVWPGSMSEIDQWLDMGVCNTALTYQPSSREGRVSEAIGRERLVLVSTQRNSPARFDPGYVFVDAGEGFARRHAEAFAGAGIAQASFGCAAWVRDHLDDVGGSAYLPEPLVRSVLLDGDLFPVAGAPEFSREIYLVTTDAAAANRAWLNALVSQIMQPAGG